MGTLTTRDFTKGRQEIHGQKMRWDTRLEVGVLQGRGHDPRNASSLWKEENEPS
jgi:hypothetical protein